MAADEFANSVFAQPDNPRRVTRGAGLRSVGLALLALAVVPIVLLLGVAWHLAQKSMEERAQADLAAVAALVAAGQDQLVEGTRQLLISVSQAHSVMAGDWAACNSYLQRLGERLPNYVSLGVLDVQGELVCRSTAATHAINLKDRPYVLRALERGEFTVGEFVTGRMTGSKTVPFALPVYSAGGVVQGLVFVGMDLKFLNDRLHAVKLPGGVSAMVTDSKGTVLASSSNSYSQVGSPLPVAALLAAVAAGADGDLASQDGDGAHWLHHVSLVPVSPDTRLYVTVSASSSELLAPAVRQLALALAAVLLFLMLYVALVGVAGARWLVNPLRRLVHAMRLIERGSYKGDTGRGSRMREVNELQRGLDAMWRGLQRRGDERDAALAASNAARAEMRAVLNQMDDGFMILDWQWNVKFSNRRGAEMVERTGQSVEGEAFWELFPDERRRSRRVRCQKDVNEGKPSRSEDFHARYGRWFEIRFFPSDNGIGVFLRDATEHWEMTSKLTEREHRYRELFESNPNIMWLFDVETLKFLAVNQAAIERYGYSKDEFLSMSITDIGPADDRDEMAEQVKLSLVAGGATLHDSPRIWRHVTRSGELILVEVARHQVTFENRLAQLVMVTDATARLIGESKLRTRLEKLTRKFGEVDSALMASRQIVLGHLGLVHEEVLPLLQRVVALRESGDAGLESLSGDAARVESLLGDVLHLSQVTRAPFQDQVVDLAALASEEVRKLRAQDPRREVHVDIEPQLECHGDLPLLAALMHALLDNAWKFTVRQDSAWIRVGRLDRAEGPPGFYVSDNGIGFDEGQQARLFMPFERLHSSAEYAGHGLGLATARAVVARHDGRLWARSTPGQGTTFCFELEPPPEDGLVLVTEVVIDSLIPQDD